MKGDAIDFENKKISIQHTVVTAKVNGTELPDTSPDSCL